jgi:hypothetical protein
LQIPTNLAPQAGSWGVSSSPGSTTTCRQRQRRQSSDAKKGGADNAFHFIGTTKFHHKKGELYYVVKNGDATVKGDVNGDGKADFAILLKHVTSLAATDFDL